MDGGRFDELTRGLASGMSRRKMLRGLAGAAAAGIAGVFVPTSFSALGQGKPYLRAYVCPGVSLSPSCENLSGSFSTYDATTCEAGGGAVVQLALPTHNGLCDVPVLNEYDSTEGIRDRFGKASWEDACAAHDCCYGTCGTTQEYCDATMYQAMTEACIAAYSTNAVQNLRCINKANFYYGALQSSRNTAWKEQQQLKCGCCAPTEVVATESPTEEILPTASLSITYGTPNFDVAIPYLIPEATGSGLQPYSTVMWSCEGNTPFSTPYGSADANGDYYDSMYINCADCDSLTISGTAADGTLVSVTEPFPC